MRQRIAISMGYLMVPLGAWWLLCGEVSHAQEPAVKVLRAVFSGAEFGEGYSCNATELVKAMCEGGKGCSIAVDASFCEGKLLPGNGNLTVMFTCAGRGQSITAPVGKTLELRCQ